ncbi:glycosyltransferase family 4 protein [Lactobacillus delbrueckii]|uniref:glycosyltransferase family 4 protein n=1 Tax=Lactobacillus delbrueckii TaxID=1584 RepID=UPI000A2FDCE8|nr:glycosyltransferase family 4 protein [Lactobacillus delbrueckii]ARR37441.1 glycosyl transferase family 1 [Lactobacillus delbrueckii subsp. delbrueckii]
MKNHLGKIKSGPLRIAMLGHKEIHSRQGGIEVVVEELATRMVKMGHQVTAFNRSSHNVAGREFDVKRRNTYKGIRLKYVPTLDKKGLAAVTSSFFGAVAAAFGRYDIVHFHAEGPSSMLWIPKMFGKRCIVTIHGLDHQRAKWGKFASAYIMMGEKCAVKMADEIIVLSQDMKDYFSKEYGRDTVFIPNGVNRPNMAGDSLIQEEYGLKKDDYILFLGRLVPEKGLSYLVEAFKKTKTDKKLVIAGGNSDTQDFTEQLKEQAKDDNRIIFTGFVQGEMLETLYSNSYIYVLPSDLEGMPLSLLEAMSYGNCCLVSDIDECASVVEDKAVLFKKSDIVDLQNKLQNLCNNPALVKKYKDEASDFICNKYNWEKIVDDTLELYRGIYHD